ncbi:hypothetical protein A2cp1_1910 [Anaeromyxobacter dehalogenans 2CP-1]|uniref:Uncharacterized protein n=1 Tax=Anaeromyxobacter dehalogenans (strain ATCC BAA-258 / DSM 21875 / 2CP-1) TaxID=455488 RepID=B8J762_ANAD2|nr:hypothetical protein A2cp1_1910 [Anaeromyxobacter dehalogenans 2CP-1]
MPRCLEWGQERHQECSEWKDEGESSCSDWDENCCDWWPCSWGCKLITWVCVAWVWVSNWVCVGWTWITTAICLVWDVVTTIVNAIIVTLESILGWVLDAIALVVELIFEIPYLGRLIKWLWNLITAIAWILASLVDALWGLIGIRPEKKLRICTIILRDENGNQVAATPYVVNLLQHAVEILRREANIRVIRLAPFEYDSGLAGDETVSEDWVQVDGGNSEADTLDVPCNASGFGADLGLTGTKLDFMATTKCFFGDFRRVVGYGAPITCFVIRTVPGDGGGCGSFGCGLWITDYITVRNQPCGGEGPQINRRVAAHELGHSGNLWHLDAASNTTNLMGVPWDGSDPPTMTRLSTWQILLWRASKHVTYF